MFCRSLACTTGSVFAVYRLHGSEKGLVTPETVLRQTEDPCWRVSDQQLWKWTQPRLEKDVQGSSGPVG